MYRTKMMPFFFKGIKRNQQIMESSNLIQEIESIRSEIKYQKHGQISTDFNRVVTTDFLDKVKQLLKKFEDVLQQDDEAKRLLEEIETMITQMKNINDKFESLTQMFDKWDTTLEKVADGIKKLDERLQKVEKHLKEMNDALDFGQAGFLFEQVVAKYVLPKGVDVGTINVYGNMIEWLNEEENKKEIEKKDGKEKEAARIMAKEKEEAKERWEEVKRMVNWNRRHEKVLKYMKRQRNNFAHPTMSNVDLKRAKNLVNNHHILGNEKACCFDIFTIIEELRLR